MKKETVKKTDEMRDEYHFDYQKAKPNRFAGRTDKSRVVVMLDADISKVFTTAESVNNALRALISVVPKAVRSRSH